MELLLTNVICIRHCTSKVYSYPKTPTSWSCCAWEVTYGSDVPGVRVHSLSIALCLLLPLWPLANIYATLLPATKLKS